MQHLSSSPKFFAPRSLLDWLLADEPSVQYFALTCLLGRSENDPDVRKSRETIGKKGWAAQILRKQKDDKYWENPESCFVPKWASTTWQLIVLADLGVSGEDERIRNSIEHFLEQHNVESGGFSLRPRGPEGFNPHVCATGNMVRTLARFGYARDERVVKAMRWLVSSEQLSDGGWNCYREEGGKNGSFRSTVEPLWALAAMSAVDPQKDWKDAAVKGSEFLLRHRIYKSKRDESPVLLEFLDAHYPLHYHYDFLHGLRVLGEPGVDYEPRMADAVNLLARKRLEDGSWPLEGVYRGWRLSRSMHGAKGVFRPEERDVVAEGWGDGYTLQLEEAGKPSKMITLQALLALQRLGLLDQGKQTPQ